jgi:flagellar biosynthesis/type III secretory pathway M-ring protein FliF/YscJ
MGISMFTFFVIVGSVALVIFILFIWIIISGEEEERRRKQRRAAEEREKNRPRTPAENEQEERRLRSVERLTLAKAAVQNAEAEAKLSAARIADVEKFIKTRHSLRR